MVDRVDQPARGSRQPREELVQLLRAIHERTWLKVLNRFKRVQLRRVGIEVDLGQPRLRRRPSVGPYDRRGADDQFSIGREDVEEIDAVAEAVSVDGHGCPRHDLEPVAEVGLVFVGWWRHSHLEDGFRHRFRITEFGFVEDP